MSDLNGNKFWKNVKPIFGNKNKGTKTMTLLEGNEAINNDEKILYFDNFVLNLGITSFCQNNDDVNNGNIDNTITNVEGHPTIVAIKEQMKKSNKTFSFQNVSADQVASIAKKLNIKKASKSDDLPTKVIKEFGIFCCSFQKTSANALKPALSLKTALSLPFPC